MQQATHSNAIDAMIAGISVQVVITVSPLVVCVLNRIYRIAAGRHIFGRANIPPRRVAICNRAKHVTLMAMSALSATVLNPVPRLTHIHVHLKV